MVRVKFPPFILNSGGYHADAVHFDGSASLGNALLTATDGPALTYSLWLKTAGFAGPSGEYIWTSDEDDSFSCYTELRSDNKIDTFVGPLDFSSALDLRTTSAVALGSWVHILYSSTTNAGAGLKSGFFYITDVSGTTVVADTGDAFNLPLNGKSFDFISLSGAGMVCDTADFQLWSNVSIVSGGAIPSASRRLFISAEGKPVDPAIAAAMLGSQTILFSGDSAAFGTNQGTGGAFTLTGSLTNASTSPSD